MAPSSGKTGPSPKDRRAGADQLWYQIARSWVGRGQGRIAKDRRCLVATRGLEASRAANASATRTLSRFRLVVRPAE